jgi:hypothetical protein
VLGSSSVTAVAGVEGEHHGDGAGVFGHSAAGVGVSGQTTGALTAMQGFNTYPDSNAYGVSGTGINGVLGQSINIGSSEPPFGIGVLGSSVEGPGVVGSSGSGPGVRGTTSSNVGAGVEGHNSLNDFNAAGVRGTSTGNGQGVNGQSVDGAGVDGTSNNGIGVSAGSLNGIAFQAFAPAGIAAIRVGGKARFSTVGGGSIPARASSAFVTHLSVTASSHVTVALTSDPGSGAVVQWIERAPGSGFTVHLDRRARDGTSFSFFIVEPFV